MEYLTIAQFAEKAGVSVQAVYKRLKTDLAPYAKEENNVKLVAAEALEFYTSNHQTKREKELLERIAQLEELNEKLNSDVTALNVEKVSLLERLAENNEKLLEIVANHQLLLNQQQQLNYRLIETTSTVEKDENDVKSVDTGCIELETTEFKPTFWQRLFPRRNKG